MRQVTPLKRRKIKELEAKMASQVTPSIQLTLDLGIQVERKVKGVEMGVLENGLPYLTQSGLATMAGVARSTIVAITKEWEKTFDEPIVPGTRMEFLKDYLLEHEYHDPKLYIAIMKDGTLHYAYPDIVCTAIIEFFAFEAKKPNETALRNYRNLARYGLQKFIYTALKYSPEDQWRYFNDRVSILQNSAPTGYFIIFSEITGLVVDLIHAGLSVNDKTIPDVSVGISWAKHWSEHGLDARFGDRMQWEHYYPDYYPQAQSNPQTPWAYPDSALPLFRSWFRNSYLSTKFPEYILKKAKLLKGGKIEAKEIAGLYDRKELEDRSA